MATALAPLLSKLVKYLSGELFFPSFFQFFNMYKINSFLLVANNILDVLIVNAVTEWIEFEGLKFMLP